MASNGNVFEEVLRLVLETQGQEALDKLRVALADVGDVSDETVAQTGKLIDGLAELNRQAGAAAQFDALSESIGQTEAKLEEAQKQAYQLTLALGSTEKPSRELQRAQAAAKADVEKLEKALASEWATLLKMEAGLREAGVDTRDLASLQDNLRRQIGTASAAVERQAKAVQDEAAALAQLKQRVADGDEQFRKMAQTNRAAADSLEAYRARAAAADTQTRKLADGGRIVESTLGRLRGVLAGLTGILSIQGAIEGTKNILGLGDAAERARKRLDRLYGAGNGQQAFDQIRQLARDSGAQFDQMLQSALKLKTFGLEPLDGTLKGLIDQNALLGGSMESLDGIILAVGQAWSKQKLQGEEIMQLVERGVPVWDLLSKATGKNVTELNRLSSAGQLGRDVIRELLEEMAKSSSGAAADGINTLSRLWTSFLDRVQGFGRQIADSGALEYFKQQLREVGAAIDRMTANGDLARYAKQVSDAITGIANAVKGSAAFLAQHTTALTAIARGYAALKLAKWAVELNAVRLQWTSLARDALSASGALDTTASRATRAGRALKSIPTNIRIGIALIGLDLAIAGASKLGEALGSVSEAARELTRVQAAMREQMRAEALAKATQASEYAKYRDELVLTAEQVSKLGAEETAAYQQRLKGLQQYLVAQYGYLLRQKELGLATQDQLNQLGQLPAKLKLVHDGYTSVAAGAKLAADALSGKISPAAQKVVDDLKGIEGDSKNATESIKKLFEGLNFAESVKLGDVALGLSKVSEESAGADRNVRDGLLAALQQLSGEELQRFQGAATAAFEAFNKGPAEAAAVLDTTLYAALDKLGVAADRMGTRFTVAGRDAVASFGAIVENANSTGQQVEAAFNAALARVSTSEDAQNLGAVLKTAGEQGKIGFDQAERSAAALEARIAGITAAMDPLTDSFSALGIQSQSSLNAARDAAKAAFDAIRQGAASGKASIEDVRRALDAYGRTARAAVADSDSTAKSRVDNELLVLDAIYRVNDGFDDMGRRSRGASEQIKRASAESSAALDSVARSAESAGAAADGASSAYIDTSKSMIDTAEAAKGLSFGIGQVSEAWMDMFNAIGDYKGGGSILQRFANVLNALTDQRKALGAEMQKIRDQTAAFDEDADRRKELRSKFALVGDNEIDELLQAEKRLDAAQDARRQKEKAAAEQRLQEDKQRIESTKAVQDAASSKPSSPTVSSSKKSGAEDRLVIEFQASGRSAASGLSSADLEMVERLSGPIASRVLQLVARSRAVSNVRVQR
jgi:tape measure domain-containing protein